MHTQYTYTHAYTHNTHVHSCAYIHICVHVCIHTHIKIHIFFNLDKIKHSQRRLYFFTSLPFLPDSVTLPSQHLHEISSGFQHFSIYCHTEPRPLTQSCILFKVPLLPAAHTCLKWGNLGEEAYGGVKVSFHTLWNHYVVLLKGT